MHYTIQVGGCCCCSWNKFPLDGREFAQWDWKSSRSSRAAIEKDKKLWVAFAWRYYISVSPLRNLQQTSGTAVGRAFKLITIVARSEWLEQLFSSNRAHRQKIWMWTEPSGPIQSVPQHLVPFVPLIERNLPHFPQIQMTCPLSHQLYCTRTVCPIEQEIKLESSVVEFIRPKTVGPCCRNESNKTQRVFYFQIGFALFAPFMYYEQRGLSICKWGAPVVKRYTHTGNGPSSRRGWRAVSKARGMVIIVKCDSEWHRHAGPPPRSNPPSLSPPPSLQMRGWS